MTVEKIEKDGITYSLMFGFGRIQKARALFATLQPESVKRLLIAKPDATAEDIKRVVSSDEAAIYFEHINSAIVDLVFFDASDWDREKVNREDYIDGYLPEDIGLRMRQRVETVINESRLSDEKKKVSL